MRDLLRSAGAAPFMGALLAVAVTAGSAPPALAADDDVKVKVGFRVHEDWGWLTADDDLEAVTGTLEDGTELRRARIELSGTLHQRTEFRAMADFAGGKVKPTDVYAGLTGLPWVGTLRAGHMKEPFGLEEMVSANDITFMERSLAAAFFPARNSGFLLQNAVHGERATWSAGVFRNTDDFGNAKADGEYNMTARVTALPWAGADGDLLHLGAALSRRSPADDIVEYGTSPESRLAPDFVSTGDIEGVDAVILTGLEAGLVYGSFSLQGEAVLSTLDAADAGDPRFSSWYVQASVIPTGERREYRRSGGIFGTVKPAKNYLGEEKGMGAVEFTARVSRIDLEDEAIEGGRLTDWTLGANWYLNPRTRVMLNYVFADLEDVSEAHVFQTRFQVSY